VIDGGMADTFFSLHCEGVEEPIFISEVVKKAMVSFMSFCRLDNFFDSILMYSVPSVS